MPEVSKEALNDGGSASRFELRMRVWERRFEKEHDRKAERADKKVDRQYMTYRRDLKKVEAAPRSRSWPSSLGDGGGAGVGRRRRGRRAPDGAATSTPTGGGAV